MNYVIEPTLINILTIITLIFSFNLLIYKNQINIDHLFYANVFLLCIELIEPSPSDIIFLSLLIFCVKEKRFTEIKYSKMRVIIWLLIFYIVITSLSLINLKAYYMGFRFYGITLYLIIYSLLIYFYTDKKNYIHILRIYVISSTLAAVLGMIGYLGCFSDYLLFDAYRVKSLFKDPNVFGAFLVPAVILLLGDIKTRTMYPKDHKVLEKLKLFKYINYKIIGYTILIIINSIGIIISYSRGAWVSLAAGILVLILINIKQINYKKIILYFGLIISLGYALWVNVFSLETKNFFLERLSIQAYDSDRFSAQLIGVTKSMDHIFGYGPGQYEYVLMQIKGEEFSAHSLYARIILENGIFGFILLMLAFGYIIIKLYRRRKEEELHSVNSIYISIVISLLINSLVIDTLHWRHLWLFIGLSISYLSDYQRLPNHSFDWKAEINKLLLSMRKHGKVWRQVMYHLIRNMLALLGMIIYSLKKPKHEILILMYHRVNDQINQAIAVKEARFDWQMKYLDKKGYKVISMEEAYQRIKDKTIDGKYIVLSFDDGYNDFYESAYPILKNYDYPAILYLVPGYIETDKVFDWDLGVGQSNLMNWEQLIELKDSNLVTIGSHTLNHYDIDTLDSEALRIELEESKKILEEKLSTKIIHFAYPKGIYDENAEKIVSEFYETGVLIFGGVAVNNRVEEKEYFKLKRMPVYRSDGKFMFIARLKGWIKLEEIVRRKFTGL